MSHLQRKRVPTPDTNLGVPNRRWRFVPTLAVGVTLLVGGVLPASGLAATIQGFKFIDSNNDGEKGNNELGFANETIYIKSARAPSSVRPFAVKTDEKGFFSFPNANPDTYEVWEAQNQPSGWQTSFISESNAQLKEVGNSNVTVNFAIPYTPPPPQLPDVEILYDSDQIVVNVGEPAEFTAKITDVNLDDNLIYRYVFGDRGWLWQTPIQLNRNAGSESAEFTLSHTYTRAGTYTMTVAATDSAGWNWNKDIVMSSVTVKVMATNPVPDVSLSPNPTFIPAYVGETVTLKGIFSDSDIDDTHTFRLDFGDDSKVNTRRAPAFKENASHVFASEGDFTVTFEVTDSQGYTGKATQVVSVTSLSSQEDIEAAEQEAEDICANPPTESNPPTQFVSTGNTTWDSVFTGDLSNAVIWIKPSHVVMDAPADNLSPLVQVKAICNSGTLRSSSNNGIGIQATDLIANYGLIEGINGGGDVDQGENGKGITLIASTDANGCSSDGMIYNEGTRAVAK